MIRSIPTIAVILAGAGAFLEPLLHEASDPHSKFPWLVFYTIVAILSLVGTVGLNYFQLKQIDIAGEKEHLRDTRDEQRDRLDADRHAELMKHVADTITSSRPDDLAMKKYAIAAKAFRLVDEVSSYLQNNKLPVRPRRPPLMTGRIPWEETDEVKYVAAYKAEFGARLKEVTEQLNAVGAKLPQSAQKYYDPGMYSWVPLSIDQIKQTASLVVTDLIRDAGLRVAGLQDSIQFNRSENEELAAPTDSVTVTVNRASKKPDDGSRPK